MPSRVNLKQRDKGRVKTNEGKERRLGGNLFVNHGTNDVQTEIYLKYKIGTIVLFTCKKEELFLHN